MTDVSPCDDCRYLVDRFLPDVAADIRPCMADSTTLVRLGAAMANAVAEYGKRRGAGTAKAAVCMIIQPGEVRALCP